MKDRVTIGQLALIYLLIIAGGKFIALPSLLAGDVGHDSWVSMCFSFLWDGICLSFLLWAIKLNGKTKLDIAQILNKTVSKVVAKVIFGIFFVIFVLRINVLLTNCYQTFSITFDVSTNWLVFMLPVAVLSFFAICRGFNAIARASQLLFALIIISVVALLVPPLLEVEMSYLLPVGEAGWDKIVSTSFTRSFWFSDYIFFYFVMDSIKVKKRVFTPVFTAFFVGVVLTVLINAVFVALFGTFAPSFNIAMSKIGVFSASSAQNGRWDWLTLSVWLLSVVIKIIVFVFCAYKCVEKIFDKSFVKLNYFVAIFITLTFLLPMFVSTETLLSTIIVWAMVPFCLVQYLLPLVMPLLTKIAIKKTEVKCE